MYTLEEVKEFTVVLNVYNVLMDENVREKFLELYHYTFGIYPNCTGCANDIEQAIQKFMWIIKKHNEEKYLKKADMLTKYSMKPKVRLYSTTLNMVVTQYNCTDAIAEVLIKENQKYSELFTVNVQSEPKAIETYSVINPDEDSTVVALKSNVEISQPKKRGRKKKVVKNNNHVR